MPVATLESDVDREGFYALAAGGLRNGIAPDRMLWRRIAEASPDLFGSSVADDLPKLEWRGESLFEQALLHNDPHRFALVYRLLYRIAKRPALLAVHSDPDVVRVRELEKSVRRDIHKMRAFLRFRRVETERGERFIAWYEPEHYILEDSAGFFVRRFSNMRWSIITPRASLHYNGSVVKLGQGGRRQDVPKDDALEDAWKIYFSSIFNPARLMVSAMLKEMPKKYWKNMPETALVKPLIESAARRATAMLQAAPTPLRQISPFSYSPEAPSDLSTMAGLKEAIRACRNCPLHQCATQAVVGEGPDHADLMIIAEQPGDKEDIAGRPLIGPAGDVFNTALSRIGLSRDQAFITNAVKHFKFTPRGKARIHSKPNSVEIEHCRWWLKNEVRLVQPKVILAMGATAIFSLTGQATRMKDIRGKAQAIDNGITLIPTVHPAYMLRLLDRAAKVAAWNDYLDDLRSAYSLLDSA